MGKKKHFPKVMPLFDTMIANDLKDNVKKCNHFTRAIRLTRTLKGLGKNKSFICRNCKTEDDLWICLYCAHVGCGRYSNQHACDHYEKDKKHHCISVVLYLVDNSLLLRMIYLFGAMRVMMH
jgi:uncharacterized UBP type Zn finger protein